MPALSPERLSALRTAAADARRDPDGADCFLSPTELEELLASHDHERARRDHASALQLDLDKVRALLAPALQGAKLDVEEDGENDLARAAAEEMIGARATLESMLRPVSERRRSLRELAIAVANELAGARQKLHKARVGRSADPREQPVQVELGERASDVGVVDPHRADGTSAPARPIAGMLRALLSTLGLAPPDSWIEGAADGLAQLARDANQAAIAGATALAAGAERELQEVRTYLQSALADGISEYMTTPGIARAVASRVEDLQARVARLAGQVRSGRSAAPPTPAPDVIAITRAIDIEREDVGLVLEALDTMYTTTARMVERGGGCAFLPGHAELVERLKRLIAVFEPLAAKPTAAEIKAVS